MYNNNGVKYILVTNIVIMAVEVPCFYFLSMDEIQRKTCNLGVFLTHENTITITRK